MKPLANIARGFFLHKEIFHSYFLTQYQTCYDGTYKYIENTGDTDG